MLKDWLTDEEMNVWLQNKETAKLLTENELTVWTGSKDWVTIEEHWSQKLILKEPT